MKKFLRLDNKLLTPTILVAILIIAATFRFYGINWDQNQHLHPDERFLTMVTNDVSWPDNLQEYFNPQKSHLNPYSNGYNFYVYGTLPMKIVKSASENLIVDQFNYNNTTLVGRFISGFFDFAVVLLVFLIGKKIFNKRVGLVSAFLYSISVLPIQLSHFYAVDTFLVFFITLGFYLVILLLQTKRKAQITMLLGLSFGMALASKISAVLFLPIIFLALLFLLLKNRDLKRILTLGIIFSIFSYLAFRISDPRAFSTTNILNPSLNHKFLDNLEQLKSFNDPAGFFPPSIQWISTKPIIHPLKNIILWGLGIPLGVLTIFGTIYSVWQQRLFIKTTINRKSRLNQTSIQQYSHFLVLSWILFLFSYQSVQFVKALRYFYPIYPFLAIITAYFLLECFNTLKQKVKNKLTPLFIGSLVFILLTVWPLSFIQIYSRPHTRIAASRWIYQNIPAGSTISCEHWDDCLPLTLGRRSHRNYDTVTLEMFNPDSRQKWTKLNSQLGRTDYLILSSNRVWGSVTKVPKKYPTTSRFYEDLLAGRTDFKKIADFASYPTIPLLNIEISDDNADETFTVYDHPKVLIYKRTN